MFERYSGLAHRESVEIDKEKLRGFLSRDAKIYPAEFKVFNIEMRVNELMPHTSVRFDGCLERDEFNATTNGLIFKYYEVHEEGRIEPITQRELSRLLNPEIAESVLSYAKPLDNFLFQFKVASGGLDGFAIE